MQRAARMKRELEMLERDPPHGASCWLKNEDETGQLEAQIIGSDDTPYHGGVFKMEIQLSDRYPFEPPKIRFDTPIYHPNIDTAGRICLDILKMPPTGSWKPSLNISTVLKSIQLLMADPNPDDPLMADISSEFKYNRPLFTQKAKEWTQKHATAQQQATARQQLQSKVSKEVEVGGDQQCKGQQGKGQQSLKEMRPPQEGLAAGIGAGAGCHGNSRGADSAPVAGQTLLSKKRKLQRAKKVATGQENDHPPPPPPPQPSAKHAKTTMH